jgi:glycosyltransferase involved in cell wall biosynthesis
MNKKIILWTNGIEYLLSEDEINKSIGGIQVQMYMWSMILVQNGWKVYSFSNNYNSRNKIIENIKLLFLPTIKYISPFLTIIYGVYYIAVYRPQAILINGATRDLLFVNLIAKLFKSKTIEMFASDSDLEPGKELIDRKLDRFLFRLGIRITDNCIVQNTKQVQLLKTYYNKLNPLVIPLIWSEKTEAEKEVNNTNKRDIILWVSNFRQLKRPEWFLQLAIDKPGFEFVMVGNNIDKELFERCKQLSMKIPNLKFLGGMTFIKTNELFKAARLFICTSEIEGFPNTFLQSWMNKCPILTTFDPSDLVKSLNVGYYCKDYQDIANGFDKFSDSDYMEKVQENISAYYKNTFSAQMHYDRLIDRFDFL